ncbi:uncharacterized protein LOC116026985 [Ipomoea triloba]|uniref:uncharacterized protein LOC116026985 n=1 Tax=Ipomoea triloba TaxID=35885 RepID=UPI00125E2C7C|nr:uncharacterized protein LOC116026985 [Ipomoea triloba]
MVNALFGELIGKTMEAYIDDMLVKSRSMRDHASDLRRSFEIMRRNRLRLNPTKCTFAVQTGKFLGFMMPRRGIEPNPAKVKAIMDMRPPTTVREVQQLTGRLAALSRFLSKLAERAHPFFQTLKKTSAFAWTDECQRAFAPIVLSRPEPGEELQIYLSASDRAISAVLCRTDPGGVQRPVYYISHALQGLELRYSRLEKFSIEYTPRPAIKGQALADFVVECSARDTSGTTTVEPILAEWEIATDGSSSKQGDGAGIVLTSSEGFKVYYALSLSFLPTNNEAEYETFIAGLCYARSLGARHVRIRTGSALVVGQVTGAFEAKGERLARYRDHTISIMGSFDACVAKHIPRAENADADMLSRLLHEASEYISKVARVEELSTACIDVLPVAPVDDDVDEWITDLRLYLETGTLPENGQRARKVKLRAPRFQIVDNRLYRRSYGGPLMRCLSRFEAELVMTELHSGLCSAHQGGQALARRIMLIVQLVTDNGKQFEGEYFQNFLATVGTRSIRSSVAYLQGNGQVENANQTILEGLKKKLHSTGRSWADELPYILWSYRTTPREATKETPFALVYGTEARLPVEAWIPTSRERVYDENSNDSLMVTELDSLEERRDAAAQRIEEYQKKLKAYRDPKARPRYFQVGDYVLRERQASKPLEGGKLAQSWEGPYVISAVVRPGTYRLETTTGRPVDRIWNSQHLIHFYH